MIAYAAFLPLGRRVLDAASVARRTDVDPVAAYLLGESGAALGELALVVGLLAALAAGSALTAVGYRLVTRAGKDEPPVGYE